MSASIAIRSGLNIRNINNPNRLFFAEQWSLRRHLCTIEIFRERLIDIAHAGKGSLLARSGNGPKLFTIKVQRYRRRLRSLGDILSGGHCSNPERDGQEASSCLQHLPLLESTDPRAEQPLTLPPKATLKQFPLCAQLLEKPTEKRLQARPRIRRERVCSAFPELVFVWIARRMVLPTTRWSSRPCLGLQRSELGNSAIESLAIVFLMSRLRATLST